MKMLLDSSSYIRAGRASSLVDPRARPPKNRAPITLRSYTLWPRPHRPWTRQKLLKKFKKRKEKGVKFKHLRIETDTTEEETSPAASGPAEPVQLFITIQLLRIQILDALSPDDF